MATGPHKYANHDWDCTASGIGDRLPWVQILIPLLMDIRFELQELNKKFKPVAAKAPVARAIEKAIDRRKPRKGKS